MINLGLLLKLIPSHSYGTNAGPPYLICENNGLKLRTNFTYKYLVTAYNPFKKRRKKTLLNAKLTSWSLGTRVLKATKKSWLILPALHIPQCVAIASELSISKKINVNQFSQFVLVCLLYTHPRLLYGALPNNEHASAVSLVKSDCS